MATKAISSVAFDDLAMPLFFFPSLLLPSIHSSARGLIRQQWCGGAAAVLYIGTSVFSDVH
jgi:hypothetical protein